MTTPLPVLRGTTPRLYRCPDDPTYAFAAPRDAVRRRMLRNLLADCRRYDARKPPARIAMRPRSPHPFHQLYITFYTGIEASAIIEQYAFAWRVTRQRRWLDGALCWLRAAVRWEHSDRVEEHFYTANRYMQAFAVALDWMGDELSPRDRERTIACLVRIMQRWWPEVRDNRHSPSAGHHVVVDNGHFGVAALALLGHHPDAEEWVRAVVDRFRAAVMPHGCTPEGAAIDGPSFWPAENMWMLHFADALRNVTGIDLYREFPDRLRLPLEYARTFLIPRRGKDAGVNSEWVCAMNQVAPVLLRMAQETGDDGLRRVALADPTLGRVSHYQMGVKGTRAECTLTYGPYAYMFYDPGFGTRRPSASTARPQPSRVIGVGTAHPTALVRTSEGEESLVAALRGFTGVVSVCLGQVDVMWRGRSVFKAINCAESQPTSCGSGPFVADRSEFAWEIGALRRGKQGDAVMVRSPRIDHEYWALPGVGDAPAALLVAARRRTRGVELMRDADTCLARLDGGDYLQYAADDHFNPDAGELWLRVRLRQPPDAARVQVLFSTGLGVPDSAWPGVNVSSFSLAIHEGKTLRFAVCSNRMNKVRTELPITADVWPVGEWRDIAVRWGGFNITDARRARPFIELSFDGKTARQDDRRLFGEMGRDVQGLASRTEPRPFMVTPRTVVAIGGAVQFRGAATACDLAALRLVCPARQPLRVDFREGLGPENGGAPMGWRFTPRRLQRLHDDGATIIAEGQRLRLHGLPPFDATWSDQRVPFAPGGFAAGSLRFLKPESMQAAKRIVALSKQHDLMLWLLTAASARVSSSLRAGAVEMRINGQTRRFRPAPDGDSVLHG